MNSKRSSKLNGIAKGLLGISVEESAGDRGKMQDSKNFRDSLPPDHVSVDKESPFFCEFSKHIGVKLDGYVMHNVHEYCASKGWVMLAGVFQSRGGRTIFKRERGKIVTVRKTGKVEPYWR